MSGTDIRYLQQLDTHRDRDAYTALPAAVQQAFNGSIYGSYRIDDIYYVETPEREYYLFELENNDRDLNISIDTQGNIL